MSGKPQPWPERFWKHVNKNGPLSLARPDLGPCWLWTGYVSEKGYARTHVGSSVNGKFIGDYVHRISYKLHKGAIPEGLDIDHLCEVKHCIRPDHLAIATRQQNMTHGKHIARLQKLYVEVRCTKKCRECGEDFTSFKRHKRRYCSLSCRAAAVNRYRELSPETIQRMSVAAKFREYRKRSQP